MSDELRNQIADLAVQVSILTDSINQLSQTVQELRTDTKEHRQVTLQLIALAQQQQATVDRLLSKN